MAITNQERVGKAMDLLRAGLAPFVEREIQSAVQGRHCAHGRGTPLRATIRCSATSRSRSGTWPAC